MRRPILVILAVMCSALLTWLTVTPPLVTLDWARLDAQGVYLPAQVGYAWPGYAAQVGLWLGIVSALGGFARLADDSGGWKRPGARFAALGRGLALAVITLLGFGLRLHTLDHLPVIIDEIGFVAHAADILHGQQVPILAPGHNGNPAVFSWLVAGVMALGGQNEFAMRLIPLALGTLTIPAAYALGREWWSPRLGLLAAVFVATYPAHVHFSRMALYNIADPLFALLALAVGARALRRGRQRDWLTAGALAGCAQYFYHGSRLLVALLALLVIGTVLTRRREIPYRRLLSGAGIGLLAFALLTLPRFAPLVMHHLPLSGNLEPPRLPADLPANSLRAALAWVGQPDISPFWLSAAPLLEWPALLAFAAGIIISVWRWRDAQVVVLLVMLALTTVFGGMIWPAAPLYVRYLTALPAVALMTALGIDWLYPHRALWWAAAALICAQAVYSAGQQPAQALSRVTPSQWWELDLAQQAAALPAGVGVALLVPESFDRVQMVTVAHAIAAYGIRRPVIVNRDRGRSLTAQLARIAGPVVILSPRLDE